MFIGQREGGTTVLCLPTSTHQCVLFSVYGSQVCLEYVSERPVVVESRWSFLVEALSLSVPFLLVATVREPQVYLDTAHLDLGDVLVGV